MSKHRAEIREQQMQQVHKVFYFHVRMDLPLTNGTNNKKVHLTPWTVPVHFSLQRHKTLTIAVLLQQPALYGDETGPIILGVARCPQKRSFSRRIGRNVALGYAIFKPKHIAMRWSRNMSDKELYQVAKNAALEWVRFPRELRKESIQFPEFEIKTYNEQHSPDCPRIITDMCQDREEI